MGGWLRAKAVVVEKALPSLPGVAMGVGAVKFSDLDEWWPNPPTIPDPEVLTRADFICGHAAEYGRLGTMGSAVLRCGRCYAPVELAPVIQEEGCSCQRANEHAPACLHIGRCFDRMRP